MILNGCGGGTFINLCEYVFLGCPYWTHIHLNITFHKYLLSSCQHVSAIIWVLWPVSIWPLVYQTEVSSQFSASSSPLFSLHPTLMSQLGGSKMWGEEAGKEWKNSQFGCSKDFIVEDHSESPALPVTSCIKHEMYQGRLSIAKNLS